MNVYITKINGRSLRDILLYMQHMTAEIAHQLGCREMGIYCYNADAESVASRNSRFDGMIAGVNRGDIVICQFPTGNGLRFERALVNHIKAYGGRIAIFVQELEALAHGNKHSELRETIELYNQAEVLIVPADAMRNFLMDNGVRKRMKFVIQEMWDYTADEHFLHTPVFQKEICFAGSDGFAGMNEWRYSVPLKLYNVSAGQGLNVHNMGERDPGELLVELSKSGFGLVWYTDEDSRQYMEYSSSFSFARYLAAGIPVIVPAGTSNSLLVEENKLGLAVYSLEEAVKAVEALTESEYQEYVQYVAQFSPALRRGYYTKKCLIEAMQAFYRRDAGRSLIPDKSYGIEDCIFTSTVLKESYGGNLALSWNFKGKPDGFQVYDVSRGIVLCDTRNVYQHYFLLKDCEASNGFTVRAYFDTLKGKLIITESEQTYLQPRQYENPKVSLIMPAYNAEDYIARSIDTALAQSFRDMELIIVNDGSTDQTQTVIDWYKERYPQVKSVCQMNGGQASARNTGIKHAVGSYIGFMDNDDMLRPDMIERLYDAAMKNDCDVSATSVWHLTKEGYEEMTTYLIPEDVAVSIDEFFEGYMRSLSPVIWNKLYRASLVKEHMLATGITFEDDAWTPYVLSYAERACYINAHLYEYDRTIRNVTGIHASWSKPIEEKFLDHREFVLFFLKNGNPEKKHLLKRLALGYAGAFIRSYSYPKYQELKEEIEQI